MLASTRSTQKNTKRAGLAAGETRSRSERCSVARGCPLLPGDARRNEPSINIYHWYANACESSVIWEPSDGSPKFAPCACARVRAKRGGHLLEAVGCQKSRLPVWFRRNSELAHIFLALLSIDSLRGFLRRLICIQRRMNLNSFREHVCLMDVALDSEMFCGDAASGMFSIWLWLKDCCGLLCVRLFKNLGWNIVREI